MIVLSAVNSKLLFEIKKRIKFMRSIEIFVIFAVRTFYLAIMAWSKRLNELVPDTESVQLTLKQVRHRRLIGNESLGKFSAIVGLDTENLERSSFDQMFQKDSRRIRTVFLKGFQIPPAGELVDCSVLVELLAFCISNDTDIWHELYVDLYSLARKVHLLVRFWNVFGIWQLNSHLTLTAKNAIQSSNRAFIAASAQFYPEHNQTGMRVPSAKVFNLTQFSFCVLVWMVMRPVRSVGKGLDVAIVSAFPAVDVLAVHIVLDGCFGHAMLLGVVQK